MNTKRIARVVIDYKSLDELLKVPHNTRIVMGKAQPLMETISFFMESPELPANRAGEDYPLRQYTVKDGSKYGVWDEVDDRIEDELDSLDGNIAKLRTLINGDSFFKLSLCQKQLMERQLEYMEKYADILCRRLKEIHDTDTNS